MWEFYREAFNYYWLKFLLTLYRMKVRLTQALGYKVTEEELEDFEVETH